METQPQTGMGTLPMVLIGVCVILVLLLVLFMSSKGFREFFGIKCPECPKCPACPPQKECPKCPECPKAPPQKECPKPPPCPTTSPMESASLSKTACPPCPTQTLSPVGNPLMIGIKYKELDNAFLNKSSKLVNTYLDKSLQEACKSPDITKIPKTPSGQKCSTFDKEFDKTVLGIDPNLKPGRSRSVLNMPKPVVDFLVELRPEMKKAFCKADGTFDNVAFDKTVQDAIKMFCNK